MPKVFHKGKWYDSKFERDLALGPLKGVAYHVRKISYQVVQDSTYEPDFMIEKRKGKIFIEAKGRFRDYAEANKYVHIRNSLNPRDELVFLFMNPKTPMPRARARKDGTKQSVSEWAERSGFRWFDAKTIKRIL